MQKDAPLSAALPSVRIGTARLHAIREDECIDFVLQQLDLGRGGWIVTLNLHALWLGAHDAAYAELCGRATLAVADGMPLLWTSRLQGTALPERITGSNLISSLTAAAAAHGRSIFLLGGQPGTAEAAAAVLRQRHPDLRIAGTLCPPMGFEQNAEMLAALAAAVADARPDIVFVALSTPKQDWLIEHLRRSLPQTWFIGIGSGLSFLCGALRRAPLWMQRLGLEWLHRLTQEPRRLASRYLAQDLPCAVGLLGRALLSRIVGRSAASERRSGQGD